MLFLRTIRYLKPRQIVDRVARAVRPFQRLPEVHGSYRILPRKPQPRAKAAESVFDGKGFIFLNCRHSFDGVARWEPAGADRLWVYNLHYFQYLEGISAEDGWFVIRDWMESCVDPKGAGWEPYPLSMRIREWIEWLHAHPEVGEETRGEIVTCIVRQTAALASKIEYHLMGNHLLENGITLCWAGLSLEGPETGRWVQQGLKILKEEIKRQVLADGTHDERSPMYQALIAEALLRLAGVAAGAAYRHADAVRRITSAAGMAMLESLGCFVHPDANYALVNDCALGVAPTYGELCQRFDYPGVHQCSSDLGLWQLPGAGYFGCRDQNGSYLIFDAGPIGPDHQPGHGHADTLSFELSHRGRRIITDTGVYTYNPGGVRLYDRGTAAHNTLEVDGMDQSEVWHAFRCGRRAAVELAEMGDDGEAGWFKGAYRGFGKACSKIPPAPLCQRGGSSPDGFCSRQVTAASIRMLSEREKDEYFSIKPHLQARTVRHGRLILHRRDQLIFADEVAAPGFHTAVLRLHIAPGLGLCRSHDGNWLVRDGENTLICVKGEGFMWRQTSSPYHPEFGIEMERPCLTARFKFRDMLRILWGIGLQQEVGSRE